MVSSLLYMIVPYDISQFGIHFLPQELSGSAGTLSGRRWGKQEQVEFVVFLIWFFSRCFFVHACCNNQSVCSVTRIASEWREFSNRSSSFGEPLNSNNSLTESTPLVSSPEDSGLGIVGGGGCASGDPAPLGRRCASELWRPKCQAFLQLFRPCLGARRAG